MANNSSGKKRIKGIAKTTGKYALKGLGKGVELAGRGTIKTVGALVKNPQVQKLMTTAGMIAAGVAIPTVGASMAMIVLGKHFTSQALFKNSKGIAAEIGDLINMGNAVTKSCCSMIAPGLGKADAKAKELGGKFQAKMDDIFR